MWMQMSFGAPRSRHADDYNKCICYKGCATKQSAKSNVQRILRANGSLRVFPLAPVGPFIRQELAFRTQE